MSIENDIDIVRPPVQFVMDKTYEVSSIGRTPELDTDDGFIPEFEVIAAHIDELFVCGTASVSNVPVSHRGYLPDEQFVYDSCSDDSR